MKQYRIKVTVIQCVDYDNEQANNITYTNIQTACL